MALELPADLEPYLETYDQKNGPGCYALELERPASLETEWYRVHDHEPEYWHDLVTAGRVLYVGGAENLLSRLERHRDNDDPEKDTKRSTALTRVCSIRGLYTAWPFATREEAFKMESRIARTLQQTLDGSFVHQR